MIPGLEHKMRPMVLRGLVVFMAALSIPSLGHTQSRDGKDRRIVVINDRSTDMLRLYGSRSTTGDWEENILMAPIPSGGRRVINFDDGTGACLFDFRAVFRDNLSLHRWSINVCREEQWRLVD